MTDLSAFAEEQNEQWARTFDKSAEAIEGCVAGWLTSHDPESLFKAAQVATSARVWREAARALRQPKAIREERLSYEASTASSEGMSEANETQPNGGGS